LGALWRGVLSLPVETSIIIATLMFIGSIPISVFIIYRKLQDDHKKETKAEDNPQKEQTPE
jgi:hypothetical protein